jgi:hypothetical protein
LKKGREAAMNSREKAEVILEREGKKFTLSTFILKRLIPQALCYPNKQ